MSIFRDKLVKQTTTKTPQQQKVTNFDQTWLKINVVGGQTQLCPIKLNCAWAYPNISQRPPQLACKWFNKTQNQIILIEGINGSYYQPCLADIGTIIHVQCIPELDDAEYEGMPIIKQIGPIKIDAQTQQQANDLLTAKKATFSIKLKNDNALYHQGLVKILGSTIKVISKLNQDEKQLLNLQICDNNPAIKCTRTKPKQIQIQNTVAQTQKQSNKIIFEVSNNKIRDVLVLLVKLIAAQRNLTVQNQNNQSSSTQQINKQQIKNETNATQSMGNELQTKLQLKKVQQKDQNQQKEEKLNKQSQQQKIQGKVQQEQQHTKQTQKSQSIKDNNSKNSQKSQQQLHQQGSNKKQSSNAVNIIKSSEDFSTPIASPSIKKGNSKYETTTPINPTPVSLRHNALQILQINDLKKQLRNNQTEMYQMKKNLTEKNEAIQNLKEQMSRMQQRQKNLSCNYFQLEDQIKKIKENSSKYSQQLSYYKNENRILKGQNQTIHKKNRSLVQQINDLQLKLQPFMSSQQTEQKTQNSKQNKSQMQSPQNMESYSQLKQKYNKQLALREQLEAKYQYMKQESQKIQQKFKQNYETIDKLENQRNYFRKKYENTSQQLQLMSSIGSSSPMSTKSKIQSMNSNINGSPNLTRYPSKSNESSSPMLMNGVKRQQSYEINQSQNKHQQLFNKYEKQILDLKRQLKQSIDQTNFLRSINAASSKDKKSSSKQQLKLQLVQMKKIVNRLTEAVAQKDLVIDHMKIVNKQISQKLIIANRKVQEIIDSQQKQKQTGKVTP